MPDADDFNAHTIEEFRANEGRVGGYFEGATMLLLHTKGAKSGLHRTNPLVYVPDGDRYVVIASKGGSHTHPDWYYNLLADPNAEIEVGTQRFPVRATVVTGLERDELYARQVERRPGFADYEKKTTRKIPVIALEPVADGAGQS
jgi:deazaflavin-dependent oxidoreductase (nitroreductase family)